MPTAGSQANTTSKRDSWEFHWVLQMILQLQVRPPLCKQLYNRTSTPSSTQPEAFLIEQSASIHHKKIWNLYNGRFKRAGTMSSFNLSYHRVPQERHRLIMGSPALIEALKRGATTEKMGWGSAVNAHKQTALPKGALLKNTTDNTPTTTY